jgi:hypothetical protein
MADEVEKNSGIQHLRDNGFKLRGFLPGPAARSRTGGFQTMNRPKSEEIVPALASSPSEISAKALKVKREGRASL